jgi:hypothetical protein
MQHHDILAASGPDMAIRTPLTCFLLIITALAIAPTAQQRGRISGNPTPGTPQPDPPKLADRITVVGCVRFASPQGQGRGAGPAGELNSFSNSTFILTDAAREGRVPPGTGTSEVAKTTKSRTYRLSAINSALVPFVGARVEISGEAQANASPDDDPQVPILQVGFVQRIAKTCS